MPWTMPPRVLQIVAALLGLAAATSFAMGILSAPQRGRLPGEKVQAAASSAPAIEAAEATPLADERIEGPPPPTPEEIARAKAAAEAKKKAEAEAKAAEEAALNEARAGVAAAPPPTFGGAPAPDEPPY